MSTANSDGSEAIAPVGAEPWTPRAYSAPTPPARTGASSDKGNVKVHSHKERRFRCLTCGKTFAATKGTPFYRLHKDQSLFLCVITLLAHGCPVPAVVAAFGLDERTVADWQHKAGEHCQAVHRHHLETKKLDLAPRPGRRAVRQAPGRPLLGGDGDGRALAAVAGRRRQPRA